MKNVGVAADNFNVQPNWQLVSSNTLKFKPQVCIDKFEKMVNELLNFADLN